MGIAYESKFDFSGYYDYSGADLLAPAGQPQFIQRPLELTYPANLKFGFLFQPTLKFGIYGDLIYNFWEDMYPTISNKLDMSGGAIVDAMDIMSLSWGFYRREGSSRDPLTGREDNKNDAVFLSAGVVLRHKQLEFHLVGADSTSFREREASVLG